MPGLTRSTLLLVLLTACGPGTGTTVDTTADTTGANTTTATAATTTAPTTGLTTDEGAVTSETPPTTSTATATTDPDTDTDGLVPCPNTGLPPAGTPCAPGICDPAEDPCEPYAFCDEGTWVIREPDPNECPDICDPFPEEGAPCTNEGAFCNTGCEDQCQFCNILNCNGGVWQHLEAPPAPCLDCDGICDFTIEPMCAAGPPDKAACVAGCQEAQAGDCNNAFSAMLACAGFSPTFSCDAEQRPLVEGCESQFTALYDCLGI